MKNIILSIGIYLAICSVNANAQKITWGHENKDVWPMQSILGYDSSGYYVYRNHFHGAVHASAGDLIEKCGYDGNVIYSKEISYTDGGNEYEYAALSLMKSGPVVLMYDKKASDFYLIKVNSDGNMDSKKTLVANTSLDWKQANLDMGLQYMTQFTYFLSASKDKKHLLAWYLKPKSNSLTLKMYGDDLNEEWDKEIEFPVLGKIVIDKVITDGNRVYFLVFSVAGDNKRSYTLVSFDHSAGKIAKVELNPAGENAITSSDLRISKSGDILFTGLYQKKPMQSDFEPWGVIGYCITRMDAATLKANLSKATAFDDNLLLKYVSSNKIANGKGISYLSLKDVVENADGSILIFAEQAIYSSMGGELHDIVIAKSNSDGSLAWTQNVHKEQDEKSYILNSQGSFGFYVSGTSLNILYNDNAKNASLTFDEIEKEKGGIKTATLEPSSSEFMIETISLTDGSASRKAFGHQYANKDDKSIIYGAITEQMGNNVIFYKCDSKFKGDKFGVLTIQ